MGPHVFLKVTSCNTGIVTLLTSVRLLSCVGYPVFLEVTGCCAGMVTLLTLVWLPCVSEPVSPEVIVSSE